MCVSAWLVHDRTNVVRESLFSQSHSNDLLLLLLVIILNGFLTDSSHLYDDDDYCAHDRCFDFPLPHSSFVLHKLICK